MHGHTRYKAALELGLKEVPCIVADDLTEEQIKAFRLADNKVGEIATWNLDLLEEELEEIQDINMDDFGFNIDFNDDIKVRDTSAELNVESYSDENFECTCPKCGFKFNAKGQ